MWAVARSRRLTAGEIALLQKIGGTAALHQLSDNELRSACGNAMSVNVLTRLVARLTECLGVKAVVVDPWDLLQGIEGCAGSLCFDRMRGVVARPGPVTAGVVESSKTALVQKLSD